MRQRPVVGVVGHVEWVEFVPVERVPRSGEIVHGSGGWVSAGGGGGVAAVQLARLAGRSTLFTALGEDAAGALATEDLAARAVDVHAARRASPQRRALTFLEPRGERTITTIGPRLSPSGEDALPWGDLRGADAVYFTAGDETALRSARTARVLVATSRVLREIEPWGIPLDALVGSAGDPREAFDVDDLTVPPALAVLTDGAAGGRYWTAEYGWRRYDPTPPPAAVADAYGAGDSFAAGLTYALGARFSIPDAVSFAARCGAEAVTRRGV